MFDVKQFGIKVLDNRKAQGLTQEQLGNAIGVSAQAVSKWENGESAPDISILPQLCRVLGVSSDELLDIENTIGIENLGKQLGMKLKKAKAEDKMKVLGYMHLNEMHGPYGTGNWNKGSNIAYNMRKDCLESVDFWADNGFAAFILPGIFTSSDSNDDTIDIIRTAVSPKCWDIIKLLLSGPKKLSELRKSLKKYEDIDAIVESLLDKGLIIQDKQGYRLDESYGLYLAGLIKAVSVTLLGNQTYGRGISTNKQDD